MSHNTDISTGENRAYPRFGLAPNGISPEETGKSAHSSIPIALEALLSVETETFGLDKCRRLQLPTLKFIALGADR